MRLSDRPLLPMLPESEYDKALSKALYKILPDFASKINSIADGDISAIDNAGVPLPSGTAKQGDYVKNPLPILVTASPNYIVDGYTCVASGSPGTWVERRIPAVAYAFPGTTDPLYAFRSLGLHMNGPLGGTTFTQNQTTSLTVTAAGNAQTSTTQSKFNGSSGAFDGNGDYLIVNDNAALQFGSGDFHIGFWVYKVSGSPGAIVGKGDASTVAGSEFSLNLAATFDFYYGASTLSITPPTLTNGAWAFISIDRVGTTISVRRDGGATMGGSTSTGAIGANTLNTGGANTLRIGGYVTGAPTTMLNGYIAEFEILKGTARYTADFTPPSVPFLNS